MALRLAQKLAPAGRDAQRLAAAMDAHWRDIYALADHVAARHIRDGPRGAFLEGPTVQRMRTASTAYDHGWKEKVAPASLAAGDDEPARAAAGG